ncbi:MAG: NADH-quinone oxidoreductase subunit NuoE [Candidatus Dasytiphilus stammeri]
MWIDNMSYNKKNTFDTERKTIEKEKKNYNNHPRAFVIEALKIVQRYQGWVSDESLEQIAEIIGISTTEVEEVATFYSQIFRRPVGRHVIRYCDSSICYINGYKKIVSYIEDNLQITKGQTTANGRFTLLPICCLGNCDRSPTIMINNDTYGPVSTDVLDIILEQYP